MVSETTTKKLVARCGIYENRPQVCRDYPKLDHYIPEECTYVFVGDVREGSCNCGVSACCAIPREGGLPGGAPLPALAGGKSCKHIRWEEVEEPTEKTAEEKTTIAGEGWDVTCVVGHDDS